MSETAFVHREGVTRGGSWRLVLERELVDLWLGGKALVLLTLFSILLGITAYLMATNNELRLQGDRLSHAEACRCLRALYEPDHRGGQHQR